MILEKMYRLLLITLLSSKFGCLVSYSTRDNTTHAQCLRAVTRCVYIDDVKRGSGAPTNSSPIFGTEEIGQALDPMPGAYSNLIRYRETNGSIPATVPIDEEFLSTVELLYNNKQQLRVLLTLMNSDRSPQWLTVMRGYNQCDGRKNLFTCTDGRCIEYSLDKLRYESTILTEDVLGFSFTHHPDDVTVILAIRNSYTRTSKAVRVNAGGTALFDALFNTVKYYFLVNQLTDVPLLHYLEYLKDSLRQDYDHESGLPTTMRKP